MIPDTTIAPTTSNYPFLLSKVNSQKTSFLGRLPRELVLNILQFVGEGNPTALVKAKEVCKKLYQLVDNPDLWTKVFSRSFPSHSLSTPLDLRGVSEIVRVQSNVVKRVYRLTSFKCGMWNSSICALLVSGENLITSDSNGSIRRFCLRTGKCLSMLGRALNDKIAAFATDNNMLLLFCLDQTVQCLDIETMSEFNVPSMNIEPCKALIISDGKVISGFEDGRIEVRDVRTRGLLHLLRGDGNPVHSLAASHGKLISTYRVGIDQVQIKSWNLESKQCLQTWTLSGGSKSFSLRGLSFDGERLFTCFGDCCEILGWDAATGNCLGAFVGHKSHVLSFAILGSRLISYSEGNRIKIWDIAKRECLETFVWNAARIESMHAVDQKLFVCTCTSYVELWDFQVEDNAILAEIAEGLRPILDEKSEGRVVWGHFALAARVGIAIQRLLRMPKRIKDQILSIKDIKQSEQTIMEAVKCDPAAAALMFVRAVDRYLSLGDVFKSS